jgi:hypothetical protein
MENIRYDDISQVIYALHIPSSLDGRISIHEYFWDYIIGRLGHDFSLETKDEIFDDLIQSFFKKSVFRSDSFKEFQHLMFPTSRFSLRPYIFAHEYPLGSISLFRPIDIDLTYCPKRNSVVIILNDYIGHFSAMFDTNHKVVHIKINDTYENMLYRDFSDDPIIEYESESWNQLGVREDLFGYRIFHREVIIGHMPRKLATLSLRPIVPSFHSFSFLQHCFYQLLCEMDYLNDLLWKCEEDISLQTSFLRRYLELNVFTHNYINFNISLHHTLWNE